MSEHKSPIPSRIYNAAVGGHVAGAEDIIDDALNKDQATINSEVNSALGGKQDTLQFDNAPTQNSSKMVNSGAIYSAIQNFVTKTVNDLVNYYTKSDTYTQIEVQQLIAAVKQFTYEVVSTLPTASASTMNKIYLTPATQTATQNIKDEYITIATTNNGTTTYNWEQIGSTTIDLSGYYTKQQTDAAITSALNSALASYSTTSQMNTAISNAVSTERSRAQAAEQLLQEQYNGLTQSDIIVGTLPASGTKNRIYRVPGTNTYSDYMWNGTSFVKMAEYDNAIDDEPVAGSNNLVKSGGVFNSINSILYRVVDYGKVQIPNYEILKADGSTQFLSGDDYDTSGFIEINNAVEVEYNNLFPYGGAWAGLCIYDSEKNLLKASGGSGTIDLSDYPLAKYLRYSYSRHHDGVYVRVRSKNYKESSTIENLINVGQTRLFTTIQDAVNSITDNSSSNRYTILVDEGDYDISNAGITHIPIKPYVNIIGVSKKARIIQRIASYNWAYNAFENISGFSGEAEIANFTIITEKSKGALHLDSNNWSGKIHFHDIECHVIEDADPYDQTKDYYLYQAASFGAINTATWRNQEIIIENIDTNGYIYSHTENNKTDNMNVEPSRFIVRNCICDWIGVYSNGDKVRKTAIIERNRCNFIKISFDDKFNLGYMTWNDIVINNNRCSFIQGTYVPYGSQVIYNLWDAFYGSKIPCPDKSLHTFVQNLTNATINRGTKVKFTDYRHRYIEVATNENDFDAITIHSLASNAYGVVQDGGDLNALWNYIQEHSFERVD